MNSYKSNGYMLVKGLYSPEELNEIKQIINNYHTQWKANNREFYQSRAINSSGITNSEYLTAQQNEALFNLIAGDKLIKCVKQAISEPLFLNTQLFFNPVNVTQKNYWHRDMQYHLNVQEQQAALNGPDVVHCRLALEDEPGIELVPHSHKNWDTPEELNVRLAKNNKLPSDNLTTGKVIKLNAGDLLLFSANMIHRGLYGKKRLALDIIFCEMRHSLPPLSMQQTLQARQSLIKPLIHKYFLTHFKPAITPFNTTLFRLTINITNSVE